MRFVNVREFRLKATQFLKANEEVVITRYGKPVARLIPEKAETLLGAIEQMGNLLREAGITEAEAVLALEQARRKVYGPRRQPSRSPAKKRAA